MNILFVLGNGFDINLGLHTGYQDFYDYYLQQPSKDETVKKLKEYLKEARYSTWADMEKGLGTYTSKVETVDQMRTLYYDLGDRLRDYLKKEYASFSLTDKMRNAINRGLIEPQSTLPPGMKDAINIFLREKNQYFIDVISFNYTDTLENILQPILNTSSLTQLSSRTYLRSIRHVHMQLEDEDVIMGVNDESQVLNKDILNDDLRGLLVKPYINQQLQNLIDTECLNLIKEADLIYLFGVSLGETDLMWWQAIGDRFRTHGIRIILFAYDKGKITRNSERIHKYAEWKSVLFNRMGIEKPTKDQQDRVFIGYKTDLFKIK